jgi:hypothetical protein
MAIFDPPYHNAVPFYIAEVVSVDESTYNLDLDREQQENEVKTKNVRIIYQIEGLLLVPGRRIPITAKPADLNNIKIPLNGEHVLVFQGYRSDSNFDQQQTEWYYLSSISLASNVNINSLPGILDTSRIDTRAGLTFNERAISNLQLFEGDVVTQGRWGNSIRFGSTVKTDNVKLEKQPIWEGDNAGDPIIIISNGQNSEDEFETEQLSDAASLYLTSTQKIPTLQLGSDNEKNPLTCFAPNESQFSRSQFIGIADRVILKAKTDIAIIDSPRGIVLNTTGEIKLGNDDAKQSMVHGDILLETLQAILNQLRTPIQCGTMTGTFLSTSQITRAQKKLQELLSSKYFISKETY